MGKVKSRKIVVDGVTYMWRFTPGYERTSDVEETYRCHDIFEAYIYERRHCPLELHFITWEDPRVGGPLHVGLPVSLHNPNSAQLNLHTPKIVAEMIRGAIKRGWQPLTDKTSFVIEDGMAFLKEMGYEVE
jgi:hypothetical protein